MAIAGVETTLRVGVLEEHIACRAGTIPDVISSSGAFFGSVLLFVAGPRQKDDMS